MSKTWAKCLNTLKDTIPLATFSVWVQPLKAIEDETNLSLLAPNTSVLNYVNKNLKKEIKSS
ncbi:MAG TPA: chromosomal replication initiator protein DnaA, partial [Piscirickettsiaceae bacterium]|nr:chromosomal replication initiator protein DnaA [Piscirickettsiaceae bacterium]